MIEISCGSMTSGKRRILKSEIEVKAFSASKMLSGLTDTNTAKVARETYTQSDTLNIIYTHKVGTSSNAFYEACIYTVSSWG